MAVPPNYKERQLARNAAMVRLSAGVGEQMAAEALKTHRWAAEVSHAAGFALEIINAGKDDGAEKVTFAAQDMQILQGLLTEIREAGRNAFLRARGTEKGYQSVRAKTAERLRIPKRFRGGQVGS